MAVQALPCRKKFLPATLNASGGAGVMASIANLNLSTRCKKFRNVGFEPLLHIVLAHQAMLLRQLFQLVAHEGSLRTDQPGKAPNFQP